MRSLDLMSGHCMLRNKKVPTDILYIHDLRMTVNQQLFILKKSQRYRCSTVLAVKYIYRCRPNSISLVELDVQLLMDMTSIRNRFTYELLAFQGLYFIEITDYLLYKKIKKSRNILSNLNLKIFCLYRCSRLRRHDGESLHKFTCKF